MINFPRQQLGSADDSNSRNRTVSELSDSSNEVHDEKYDDFTTTSPRPRLTVREENMRKIKLVRRDELKSALPLLRRLNLDRRECNTFESIDIINKNLTPTEAAILYPFLRESIFLVNLKMSFNRIGNAGALHIAKGLEYQKTLKLLDLGFNGIGDEGAMALSSSLVLNQTLRTLYLSGNAIGPQGAKYLAEALCKNDTLQVLHLTGNSLTSEGACYLGEALLTNKALLKLFISGSSIGQAGAASLALALEATALSLSANPDEDPAIIEMTARLNSQSISAEFAGFEFDKRQQVSGLEWLYMSQNKVGDAGVGHIAKAMRTNRGLRAIELGFNDITSRGMELLAPSLLHYNSLMYLYVDNNNLGCEGACHLSNVLNKTKIHLLDVGFDNIGQEGMRALMVAVGTNESLTALVLSGNKFNLESAMAVAEAVEQNSVLRELYMDQTDMTLLGHSYVVSSIVNNKNIALRKLTGFHIGEVAAGIQVPALNSYVQYAYDETIKESHFRRKQASSLPPTRLEDCNNELVLTYVRGMWKRHEQELEDDMLGEPTTAPPPLNSPPMGSPLSELLFGDVFDEDDVDVDISHGHNSMDHLAAAIATTTRQYSAQGLDGGSAVDKIAIKRELERIATMPFASAEFSELRCHFFNESIEQQKQEEFAILKPPNCFHPIPPSSPLFSVSPPLKRARNLSSSNCQIRLYPALLHKLESLTDNVEVETLKLLRQLKYLEFIFGPVNSNNISRVPSIEAFFDS